MIIDFDKIEVSIMPAFKGGEKETRAAMFTDENNRIMMGMLIPGATIGLHRHEASSQEIFIQNATGKLLFSSPGEKSLGTASLTTARKILHILPLFLTTEFK